MAHKLVSVATTALLVLVLALTLPADARAASLSARAPQDGSTSWNWLTAPWLGRLLSLVLPGPVLDRAAAPQGSAVDPNGTTQTDTSTTNSCKPLVPGTPVTSVPSQGSACDPNG